MDAYLPILCGSGAVYIALLVALWWGLTRVRPATASGRPTVAIVVAARNEARNIDACLDHLARQDYPEDLTRVVVVDDASTDDTFTRAEQWRERLPGLQVVRTETCRYRCRKKSAVDLGIRSSESDLILTTDADCRPPPTWISSVAACFEPDVGVVIGHAPLVPRGNVVQTLLAFQSTVVSALSAGSAGLGFPLTCTGRNLAYRRAAYRQVGGFEGIGHIVGGDDVLLMRRIAGQTPFRARFQPARESHVPSDVHETGLFRRQIRYQSKAVHAGTPVLVLALGIYLFHLALAVGPAMAWARPDLQQTLGMLLALKAATDGAFLWRAHRLLGAPFPAIWLPIVELVTIPYVVLFFAIGSLGSPRWK